MKNIALIWVAMSIVLSLGCEEHPPFTIDSGNNTGGNDTTTTTITPIYQDTTFVDAVVAPQEKVVLLEDFTGVQCVNCPAGHEVVEELLTAHSGRVLSVAIHAGFLSDPIPNYSSQDLVIPEGQALYDMLEVPAVPAAGIDRVLFDGEPFITVLNANRWSGKVAEQLLKTTPINLYTHKIYDANSRNIDVFVQLRYTENQTNDNRIHVFLIENEIVEAQENAENGETQIIANYNHQRVLRKIVTPVEGFGVSVPDKQAGRAYVKRFSFQLPSHVNPNNCQILTFVQEKTSDSQTILQSSTVAVVE